MKDDLNIETGSCALPMAALNASGDKGEDSLSSSSNPSASDHGSTAAQTHDHVDTVPSTTTTHTHQHNINHKG